MIQDVDGRRVEARWWGERSGTTLVLLHEGLGCVDLWRDFPERLAAATGCRFSLLLAQPIRSNVLTR